MLTQAVLQLSNPHDHHEPDCSLCGYNQQNVGPWERARGWGPRRRRATCPPTQAVSGWLDRGDCGAGAAGRSPAHNDPASGLQDTTACAPLALEVPWGGVQVCPEVWSVAPARLPSASSPSSSSMGCRSTGGNGGTCQRPCSPAVSRRLSCVDADTTLSTVASRSRTLVARNRQRVGAAGNNASYTSTDRARGLGTMTVDISAAAAQGQCRQPDRGGRAVLDHRGSDAGAGSTAGWRDHPHGAVARPRRSPDRELTRPGGRDHSCPKGADGPSAPRPVAQLDAGCRRRRFQIRMKGLDCRGGGEAALRSRGRAARRR